MDETPGNNYHGRRMQCTVLGSGSQQNSYLFQTDSCTFAIDNGFSLKEFAARAGKAGCDYRSLDFILVTHGHGDHLKGVGRLSQAARAPVYVSPEVDLDARGNVFERRAFRSGERRTISGVEIHSFPLNHDSPGAQSFRICADGRSVTIITDTGSVSADMYAHAQETELLFLEANYCPEMLKHGPYPEFLKRRIGSDKGHLSNSDAIVFLNSLSQSPSLRRVYFCHLSDVNNDPEVLTQAIEERLSWQIDWSICRKNQFVRIHGDLTPRDIDGYL